MKLELARQIVELDTRIQFAKKTLKYMEDLGNQRVYLAWTSHLRDQVLKVLGKEEGVLNTQLNNQLRELVEMELVELEKQMKRIEQDET